MTNYSSKNESNEKEEIYTDFDFGFNDGSSKYDQVYFVKPLLKNGPFFNISWNNNGSKFVAKSKEIQGELLKIEESEYVYDDKLIETVKIHLKWKIDNKPVLFILGSSYTGVLRNLINTLLSVNEPVTHLKLVLYEKDGFPNVYIRVNNKKGEWKYNWSEMMKKVVEIKNPKTNAVIQKDYSELNEFLKTELLNHLDIILSKNEIIDGKPIEDQSEDDFFNFDEG